MVSPSRGFASRFVPGKSLLRANYAPLSRRWTPVAMLLELSTTHSPASDLGFLLEKHPARVHDFEIAGGKATVFYREANEARCTVALLLDIDPVGLVRGKGPSNLDMPLQQYVNDRP